MPSPSDSLQLQTKGPGPDPLRPSIFINDGLDEGEAALAAAHAAVAWYSRITGSGETGADAGTIPNFMPFSITRVAGNILEKADTSPDALTMHEGSSKAATAVICPAPLEQTGVASSTLRHTLSPLFTVRSDDQAEAPEESVSAPRMYILMNRELPSDLTPWLAALSAVAAFAAFGEHPKTREWIGGKFYKVVCGTTDTELSKVLQVPHPHVELSLSSEGLPDAIAFRPRSSWDKIFRTFRLL